MKKHVFQLVRKADGQRSQEFVLQAKQFAEVLQEQFGDLQHDYYVLVLADIDEDNLPLFSQAPLMETGTFVSHFNPSTLGDN